MELRYQRIALDIGPQFIFVFMMRKPSVHRSLERSLIAEVIEWCEERFGPGAIPSSKMHWDDLSLTGKAGIAASHAWVMDHLGNIGFQADDHAFEFKLRWC